MSKIRRKRPVAILVEGKRVIGCPFCRPSHPLPINGTQAICGTWINVEAVQNTYFERELKCVVCGNSGGNMVRIGDSYRHSYECKKDRVIYAKQPKLNVLAKLAWKLPKPVMKALKINPIEVTNQDGEVLGYTWDL